MRQSRVREKLKAGKPVLCTKMNTTDPVIVDIIGLLGFDCLWICTEHVGIDWDRLSHMIRTAALNDMDTMVRVARGSYSDFIRPYELGATGLMIPHCTGPEDARYVVRETRYHPLGRRGCSNGNADGHYYMTPFTEHIRLVNENTFVTAQIEDPEAVEAAEAIAAIEGIDIIFIGPGDLSQGYGLPGQINHPTVQGAIKRVADACNKHHRTWGLPVTPETAPKYMEMGARFLTSGFDVIGLERYFQDLRRQFQELGVEFAPKI